MIGADAFQALALRYVRIFLLINTLCYYFDEGNERVNKKLLEWSDSVARHGLIFAKAAVSKVSPCPFPERETRIVAGAQRSGTNLLMDVLERCWEADVYHERDPRAFKNYQMRPLAEIQKLRQRSTFEKFVIKALCESQKLDALLKDLAPARAVWVIRHYNDVVNSMTVSFPGTADMLRKIAQDKDAGGWRTEGMSAALYSQVSGLVNDYGDKLDEASACALQWYFRNALYLEKGFAGHPDIRLLRYEDLVLKPADTIRSLFDFFTLAYRPSVHCMISPYSVNKRRSPDLLPEVKQLCDGLWQRFLAVDKASVIS